MTKIEPDLIGRKTGPVVFEYTWKDVVLYALGVGATAQELSYVYEKAPGGLKVLPGFCVVPALRAFPDLGSGIEWSRMLHGEQTIRLAAPLPPQAKLIQTGEVVDIFDKGKGTLFHVRITGETEEGTRLYEAQWSIFYVGGGGFSGNPGPRTEPIVPPAGVPPDFSISEKTAENQAALYRLSGDLNPLHLDPAAAARGGFDRPVLHGLCTYGFATRAIIKGGLAGEAHRLKAFSARFTNVVYPGETLTTEGWKSQDGFIVQAKTARSIVLSNARAVID